MNVERTAGRDERLARFRKTIFRMIARGTIDPQVVDPQGTRPILAAHEHELTSDVFVRAARTGGFANLFVLLDDGGFVGAGLLPQTDAILSEVADSVEEPIHQDLEIGMLVRSAGSAENGLNVRVRLPEQQGEVRDARRLTPA